MYAQNNEDDVIAGYFGSAKGKLLDIGAYDGKSFSNSFLFLTSGWSGVLVEPLPTAIQKIEELYSNRKDVALVKRAIGPENKPIKFFSSEMFSVIEAKEKIHREKWYNQEFKEITVEQMTVSSLFEQVGCDFTYASIDVENYNLDIVQQLPEKLFETCKCFCVEYDAHEAFISSYFSNRGYRLLHKNAENLIYVR